MKTYTGEPFYFNGGRPAVILLHAYSGNSNDVRMLGRTLQKHGYTVYAPVFTGHGGDPCRILRDGDPDAWWEDTQLAIRRLRDSGHDQLAIFGLSLGGLFATRALENDAQLSGGGVFASPITTMGQSNVPEYFQRLAMNYYRKEQTPQAAVDDKMAWIKEHLPAQLAAIQAMTKQLDADLDQIHQPFFIAQGGRDEMIDPQSGAQLADRLRAQGTTVDYHFYPDATHLLTVNTAHRQLFADVLDYLQKLFEVSDDNKNKR